MVPNSFDVFDAATGAIDYCARDVEAIGAAGLGGDFGRDTAVR